MSLNYAAIKSFTAETVQDYSLRDVILYALGVGAAQVPGADLDLVYETRLKVLPSMASVLATPRQWLRDPTFGVDYSKLVHSEQAIELQAPIPPSGRARGLFEVEEVYDRGEGKGAIVACKVTLRDDADGQVLAQARLSYFLRGDGGFGGAPPPPSAFQPFEGAAQTIALQTRPEQAAIYRLSGDSNPLHIDPAVAEAAGFPTVLLHGLATFGFAGRAAGMALADGDATCLRTLGLRFNRPVYPGDALEFSFVRQGDQATFTARVPERDVTVLVDGFASL
jgi:acyl dehydratase